MAIKVKLGATENTQKEKPFPKLMISEAQGRIVFFIEPKVGVQINTVFSDYEPNPHFSEDWDMRIFTDYNEPITLINE